MQVVRAVDATPDGVTVTCSDGSSFEGEYVVVSVPLGVLKVHCLSVSIYLSVSVSCLCLSFFRSHSLYDRNFALLPS